jgi:nitroreductase
MDAFEAIYKRRTIREFAPIEINPEVVQKIIAAGMAAPSNNHMREWHFVLLQDAARRKELLDQVINPVGRKGALGIINRWGMTDSIQREMYLEGIPRQYSMLSTCSCLILPFFYQPGDLLKPQDLFALNAFASIWCCVENMLIAAAAEGIFGVTRIPFEATERKILKKFLNVPVGYETPCFLALGYPAEDAVRARQVEISAVERIHLDSW